MSKSHCLSWFALSSTHVKFDVWPGPYCALSRPLMPNTHTPSLSSYFFLNRVTSYCVQKQILAYEVTHAFRDVIFVMQISCRAQTILTEKSWKCDENTGCNDVTVGVVTNLARNDAAYFIDQSTAWQTDNRHRPHYKIWPSADSWLAINPSRIK